MRRLTRAHAAAALGGLAVFGTLALADTVTLKNGIVYKGLVDKDNTLVSIFDPDGLKRVILRDSKIAKTDGDGAASPAVVFAIEQPLTVHAGEMPKAAIVTRRTEWDSTGRRTFAYIGPRGGKPTEMTQAIIGLGPRVSKIRGVDGFWVGQIATSTVPRAVVLDILGKVDQKNLSERLRVCRFLIQAEWYTDARKEVARLLKDFLADPDVADKAKNALELIQDSEARGLMAEIDLRRAALQPRAVLAQLKTFPTEGVASDILASVKEHLRKHERQVVQDQALTDALKRAFEGAKIADNALQTEILSGLAEAPESLRPRLEAFEKALADNARPEELSAFAISGWVAGVEQAVGDLKVAVAMVTARDLARDYLATRGDAQAIRSEKLASLQAIEIDGKPISPAALTEIVRLMPPPCRDGQDVAPEKPLLLRVLDDPNPDQPSEYAVLLPPEYSPLRSYPMVVALHADETPLESLKWWAQEAARRGFVVIAPEYNLRDQAKRDYRYTQSEIAAAVLAHRDALKRFAIDPDRVFLGGSLIGGNMAWDFGLSHPDLFAGVVVISGMPAKYVWANRSNTARVPFYIAIGDLVPGETDYFFGNLARPLIIANRDMTYVEYYRRGLEDLPEEARPVFDWMAPRRRDPLPKTFDVVASREGDERFYGVVVREFVPGRTKDPSGVDVLGKGLKPATIEAQARSLANLITVTTSGVRKMDVWVSPKVIDFTKKMEVRVNNKTIFKGMPKPDVESFLEDVRIRGDRSQVFWMRVPTAMTGARN